MPRPTRAKIVRDPAEIRRRLDAGEWLSPMDAAALLDVSNMTIWRYVDDRILGYKLLSPEGRRRQVELDPADVTRLLEERQRPRRGPGNSNTPAG